jgi:hypothetical protein
MLRPTASLHANKVLNALITNCWPRFSDGPHDAHVVRTISIGWLQLHDSSMDSKPSAKDFQNLTHELKLTAKMLHSIRTAHGTSPPAAMTTALDHEPLLRELFDTPDDA